MTLIRWVSGLRRVLESNTYKYAVLHFGKSKIHPNAPLVIHCLGIIDFLFFRMVLEQITFWFRGKNILLSHSLHKADNDL